MRALLLAGVALLGARAAAAQQEDRWQLTRSNGTILWDLQLVRLSGDTLAVRNADSTYRFPIRDVDELRLVRKSEHRANEPGTFGDALGGVGDVVYRLTLYTLAERRQILAQVFHDHPPSPPNPSPPSQSTSDLWQITLKDGTIVWNLRLERLQHDTIVFWNDARIVRYPLLRVDELRLVRAGEHEIGPVAAGGRYDGAPNGTSDVVYQLTLLDLAQRRQVVQEILQTRNTAPPPARP